MGYDGTGVYTPSSPEFPAVSGNVIRASEFNAIIQSIAAALSLVLVRDGQAPMLAALNMGTNRITSLATGTTDTDAATVAQARTIPSTATLDGIAVTALMALNGVTPAADGMLYYTSESAAALLTVVAAIRALLASEDVATFRANAGLAIGTDVQAFTDAGNALAQIEGAANRLPIFTAADTASYLTVVSAVQTALASADLATFRSNVGLAIGTDVLAFTNAAQALAALTPAADKLPYFTGSTEAANADFTAFARTMLAGENAAEVRSLLGVSGSVSTIPIGAIFLVTDGDTCTGFLPLVGADISRTTYQDLFLGTGRFPLNLSSMTHEDVKGSITTLTVDVANTSGHFNTAAGAKVLAGCRIVTADGEVFITSITGGGTGTSGVAFGGTLAAGAHTVTGIHGTAVSDGALVLSTAGSTGTPSYANSGGTGNRSALITPSSTLSFGTGSVAKLIDGGTGNDCLFTGESIAGKVMKFDFTPLGARQLITEITWKQNGTYAQGTWQWQGSDDGTTWVDIGTTFALGTASTQAVTTMSGATQAYWMYRLLGVSGTTSAAPWLYEIEFKIAASTLAAPINTYYIATGTIDASLIASITSASVTSDADGQTITAALSPDGGTTWEGLQDGTNLLMYSERLWGGGAWTTYGNYTVTESTDITPPTGMTGSVGKYTLLTTFGRCLHQENIPFQAAAYTPSVWMYVPYQAGVTGWRMNFDIGDGGFNAPYPYVTLFDTWVRMSPPSLSVSSARTTWLDFDPSVEGGMQSGFTFYLTGAQLRQGTHPGEYVPTTDSAATGPMDWVNADPADPSGWSPLSSLAAVTGFPSLTGDIGVKIALKTTDAADNPAVSQLYVKSSGYPESIPFGTTYGDGDGSTTFGTPDLSAEAPANMQYVVKYE